MRLLNSNSRALEEFPEDGIVPRYAIAIHHWGHDEYSDFQKIGTMCSILHRQVYVTCRLAVRDGLDYVWIDFVCSDREDRSESTDYVGDMFRPYTEATVCYLYLDYTDLETAGSLLGKGLLAKSWSLQELLVPKPLKTEQDMSKDMKAAGFRNWLTRRWDMPDNARPGTGLPDQTSSMLEKRHVTATRTWYWPNVIFGAQPRNFFTQSDLRAKKYLTTMDALFHWYSQMDVLSTCAKIQETRRQTLRMECNEVQSLHKPRIGETDFICRILCGDRGEVDMAGYLMSHELFVEELKDSVDTLYDVWSMGCVSSEYMDWRAGQSLNGDSRAALSRNIRTLWPLGSCGRHESAGLLDRISNEMASGSRRDNRRKIDRELEIVFLMMGWLPATLMSSFAHSHGGGLEWFSCGIPQVPMFPGGIERLLKSLPWLQDPPSLLFLAGLLAECLMYTGHWHNLAETRTHKLWTAGVLTAGLVLAALGDGNKLASILCVVPWAMYFAAIGSRLLRFLAAALTPLKKVAGGDSTLDGSWCIAVMHSDEPDSKASKTPPSSG